MTTDEREEVPLGDRLGAIRREAVELVESADSSESLDRVAERAIGRDSSLGAAQRSLGTLSHEERPEAGRLINEVRRFIDQAISSRRAELEAVEQQARIESERIDVTIDHEVLASGGLHLVQQVIDEVSEIFIGLGYKVADGPEAELAWYNFDALNTPPDHPGRLESDTMYLDYGPPEAEMLMRAHTSPVQARYMETNEPPVYIIVPGRTYRNDTIDATHLPVFHQIEGLAVDENIPFSDLKGTLAEFARRFFGAATQVRMRPHYFPFTEPSAELDVSCFNCDGGEPGCRVCKGSGWLELLGCGMVDPNVYESVGYDPSTITGFAFGMGVERLAMVRHGIDSLRHFIDNDLRFLQQFPG